MPRTALFVRLLRFTALAMCLMTAAVTGARGADKLDYGRDVRPILSENCFHCHGQDAKKRMAGLRLDTFDGAAQKRGDRAAALVPGNAAASGIYQRITADKPAMRMPPAHSNRVLKAEQIATLKQWIEEGGGYAKHWAFTPPIRPAEPRVTQSGWIKQPLDAFVLHRLEREKLAPSPAASPAQWLRRATLDLTGLPPTPSELSAFEAGVKAHGDAAYQSAADRLLASPRYGERMAMDWLDVARYADTHGFNNDASRSMWRWRDWVIESLNANVPYDRFLTEQLAGDLLPNATVEQRIATGYGRNHVINSEGGIIDEEYRLEYVADRVRTLGMSWLGLTLECARCHDHKYDPITQRDHYRLFAFFNNVPEIGEDGRVANAVPMMPAPTAGQRAALAELERSIARLALQLEARQSAWRWQEQTVPAPAPETPAQAAFFLSCEAGDKPNPAPAGIEGPLECAAPAAQAELPKVPISKRGAVTLTAWIKPGEADRDAPLFSALDYARNPAATTYGNGIELRLIDGELEFRFGQRFPAYSIRVRSEGAGLSAGQWRHIAVVYTGSEGKPANRMQAAWVRLYADGQELATRAINDGAQLPDEKSDKANDTRFRLGWDNHPETSAPRFTGQIDEYGAWPRRLSTVELANLFAARALPYAAARQRAGQISATEQRWLGQALLPAADAAFAETQRRHAQLRGEWLALRRDVPTVMVMQELATPRATHVLLRGAYNAPGERVEPGVPEELLGAWPRGAPKNRLGLAQWLTKADHPLTARVVANRFWQQLFGQGLVKTSENFGAQGSWPSHPDLLDFLAREFVDSGWNVKALMKQIVLSATYRQDSTATGALIARDPENQLLARGPRFRLPAEVIRDQALAAAGLLTHHIGGPSVFPYQPAGLYNGIVVAADYPGTSYVESKGADLYRRSLYTFWKRTVPHPTMTVFDAPDREFCIVRRSTTNTPLQALTLLNDPIFVEAARQFAERLIREGGNTPDERLAFGFRLATGRAADAAELGVLRATFERMISIYRASEQEARALVSVGASARDEAIPIAELAAYTAVTNMILNLDEVVTKG